MPRVLVEHLDHDDHDVRRNAALALALFGRGARPVAGEVLRARRLDDPLRDEVLRRLLPPSDDARPPARAQRSGRFGYLDAASFPWGLSMSLPEVDIEGIAADCERQWAAASGGDLDYRIPVPKWAFLHYLVERHGLLMHGSHTAGLDVLEPRSRSWGGGRTSGQPGVFAVDHALMAMYFGLIHPRCSLSNAVFDWKDPAGQAVRGFVLGVDFAALSARPFADATAYIVRPDTFTMMGELTSHAPVRPLARLSVSPSDFPLLEHLWGADIGPLATQFGPRFALLGDVGLWGVQTVRTLGRVVTSRRQRWASWAGEPRRSL